MQHNAKKSGQIGIIIILIMVVLLTFGLSIASRSTREVALSQQEEESNRVFNAAEAGVERALATDLNFAGEQLNTNGVSIAGTNSNLNYNIKRNRILDTRLIEGTTAMVQMQDAANPLPTQMNIDWSKDIDCAATKPPASLIVSIYNTTGGVNTVRHALYAACAFPNDGVTGVTTPGLNGYFRRISIATQSGDQFMRVKSVLNDTYVMVSASSTLPTQAYDIRSDANSQLGQEARSVQVHRTLSVAPSVMDFALFSGNTLSK